MPTAVAKINSNCAFSSTPAPDFWMRQSGSAMPIISAVKRAGLVRRSAHAQIAHSTIAGRMNCSRPSVESARAR